MKVVDLVASETHALRRLILRDGDPTSDVVFPQDATPGAFHLGVRSDRDELVGVASFSPALCPAMSATDAWQLRGMGVVDASRGSGAGRRLLETAFDRLRSRGADLVWANARDVALPFYERLGMRVVGPGFLLGPKGDIPHHLVVIEL